jgi:ParB family transcriptional regulator, chromosome partitioning protein
MSRKYGSVKAGRIKHSANHIRADMGTEEELRQLGSSYLKRPLNPIICRQVAEYLEALDGNRRLAGVLLVAGPDADVQVCITDEPLDESAKLEIQLESAIHTRGLSLYEVYVGGSKWLEHNKGATAEQLGERIGRKPAMMSRILSLGRCIPAVKEAAASGLIGVTEWNELSKCDEQQQQELLAARLAGQVSSRDQLAQAVRKSRSGNAPAVKLSRVKIAMPEATLVISGKEMSMSGVVELLTETLKEARKAAETFDVKTWQRMMKDKARAK